VRAIEAIRKRLVSVPPSSTLSHAAEVMESANVGAVVVLDGERLAGIVTDRDIVVRGVAHKLPADARVDAVMTTEVVTLHADADLRSALPIFNTHACRRLPLMRDDRVVGMLTVDDLLVDLIADLADVARPITGEIIFGHHDTPVPDRTR
jgi:CBS domain-containing protein